MKRHFLRALVEVGFIVFLFYANLLMGEYERSAPGQQRGVAWAVAEIFTLENFLIALGAGVIGYVLFELLRKRL